MMVRHETATFTIYGVRRKIQCLVHSYVQLSFSPPTDEDLLEFFLSEIGNLQTDICTTELLSTKRRLFLLHHSVYRVFSAPQALVSKGTYAACVQHTDHAIKKYSHKLHAVQPEGGGGHMKQIFPVVTQLETLSTPPEYYASVSIHIRRQ